jgi:hypothetical protein
MYGDLLLFAEGFPPFAGEAARAEEASRRAAAAAQRWEIGIGLPPKC